MAWRAFLKGHPFDLEFLVEQFDRGRARVLRKDDEFWLESPSFGAITDVAAVQTEARGLLEEMNGAAKLVDGSIRAVELQDRFSDGGDVHQVLVTATAESRTRAVVGKVVVQDEQGIEVAQPPAAPTDAPNYLDIADRDPAVREVMRLLSDDHPDWVVLYKIKEVVEADAGKIDKFATKTEVSAFGASATARMSAARRQDTRVRPVRPPRHTMTLDQGRAIIRKVVQAWLASKEPQQADA